MSTQVTRARVVEAKDGTVGKEDGQKAGDGNDLNIAPGRSGGRAQATGELIGQGCEVEIGGLVEQGECGEAGSYGEWITRERAGLVDLAGGGEQAHQIGPAGNCGGGEAAAKNLAEDREVAAHARQLLRSAASDAKARDHLIEDQQRTTCVGLLAEELEEALTRRDEAHVG